MKKNCFMFVFFFCIVHSLHLFANREPKPAIETTRVKEHFYKIFVHEFVNMLVFEGSDGILLVDSGFDPVDMIEKKIRTISNVPIRYLINTHSNGDHILGNAVLGKEAVIVSSTACRDDILKRKDFPSAGLPNLTFSDSMRIHFNGEEIGLYFMPGHTGNDIVIYFKNANIVCIGDLVFSDSFPGTQASRGGNAFVLEKTFDRLIKKFPENAFFISGHGRDYSMTDMRTYDDMIQKTIAIVKPLIDKGLTLDEIKKQNPLKNGANWNSTFFPGEITTDTWIENIYESVADNHTLTDLKSPYLGQNPPGSIPELFGAGFVSTGSMEHQSPAFNLQGTELYYMVNFDISPRPILTTRMEDGYWISLEVASFSGCYNDGGTAFSPDGTMLYFHSVRPLNDKKVLKEDSDIWVVERTDKGWTEPRDLGLPINTNNAEYMPSISQNKTIYFVRRGQDMDGIFYSHFVNSRYEASRLMDKSINTNHWEAYPFIAPDESYFMFASNRPGGLGSSDLYICYRKKDGSWTEPMNLGNSVNSERWDAAQRVSLDGKYLFFAAAEK